MAKRLLVTGGAGFIGSWFVDKRVALGDLVITVDCLNYAANLDNLASVRNCENHIFVQGDIRDSELVLKLLKTYQPDVLVNFAAETHVDRSILSPAPFINTNVVGVEKLLSSLLQWREDYENAHACKFIQISTDEVYGSSTPSSEPYTEDACLRPSNPYSASKASADLLVQAYGTTYGLPYLIVRCSNNYGPRQFPEKLFPHFIKNALERKVLPVYGDGENLRTWLYVQDCCDAISLLIDADATQPIYNIAGDEEMANLLIAYAICSYLNGRFHVAVEDSYLKQIQFVKDRPGHDFRYSIDSSLIRNTLGWKPKVDFMSGLSETIEWYLANPKRLELPLSLQIEFWSNN